MRYFQPKSVTWWSGLLSVVLGLLMLARPDLEAAGQIATVLSALNGGADTSPAGMILLGAGLIGLRDKLERIG